MDVLDAAHTAPCRRCGWPAFLFERYCPTCSWDRWELVDVGRAEP